MRVIDDLSTITWVRIVKFLLIFAAIVSVGFGVFYLQAAFIGKILLTIVLLGVLGTTYYIKLKFNK